MIIMNNINNQEYSINKQKIQNLKEKSNFKKKYVFLNDICSSEGCYGDYKVSNINNLDDFRQFYQFPFTLYKNNKNWVAPFWNEINDFFKSDNIFWSHSESKLFIIKKEDKVVGRIASIIDKKYCEYNNQKIGFFGFFECINDKKCAEILFEKTENWLKEKGMNLMRGPIDGRVDMGCGFLYKGFNLPSSLLSTYTPKYYNQLVENYDFKKSRDLIIYYVDLKKHLPKKLEKIAEESQSNGLKIRFINRLKVNKELNWWTKSFLRTFSNHWGYVPVSSDEVKTRFGVNNMRWYLDSKLFLIAEKNKKPVAYIWATPDYNQIFKEMNGRLGFSQYLRFLVKKNQINVGKLHLIGIEKEYRDKNIASYLNYLILIEMIKRGYVGAEVGWIDEENKIAHNTISKTGAYPFKIHRVYEKKIKNIN